ncbi:gamma carbonic anhydrase family protein [Burkholderia cenocepacia]|uniref:gamma carbonic anhydrase family protein n=1 Tax=Burkholderia cenocepacia TaxID=95486 RepID=UPI002857469D|nr:gamma carbonic anhydrase family protein [Burkholderia cenocepacia]MDR8071895.1 gamma carbonic anhydrase family protein [Burkholderia cenocepacia]
MPLFKLGDVSPDVDETAYVAEGATLIGRARVGADSSIWTGAVVRADNDVVLIGPKSNVQEGAVLHADPGFPLVIGEGVTVGHQAMLHGCTIGDGCLIGIQAVVLNGASIGKDSLVGAGALVTERKNFPEKVLILGAPAKVARSLSDEEVEALRITARGYVTRANEYRKTLVRVG